MITVKILCACGQKYAFDVEPYNGRMPAPIHCPICKADGTQAANEIIARSLPPQPIPAVAPPPPPMVAPAPRPMTPSAGGSGLRIGSAAQAAPALKPISEAEAAAPAPVRTKSAVAGLVQGGVRRALSGDDDDDGAADKWKWWYYVLAGIGIIGYDAWMLYDTHRLKFIGGIVGGIFCIVVGVWDFQRKRTDRS